ncbi:KEOPS complex subunit Pcc1 [Salinarchaeum laminariae]|uniref:KEOPS complex subunit Pcc1 n=1 Tax=Salinarchaeum laminariae TaxID=869888 RepID=UPI0020BEBDFA
MTDRNRVSATDADTSSLLNARRATITSEVDSPETVAAAIAPDDTDEIDTRVEDGRVVTTIERETTGGLEATIDDYVVALDVATTTVDNASRDDSTPPSTPERPNGQASVTDEQHANRTNTDTQ